MSWRDRIRTTEAWVSSRPWSRAGAIAQVLATDRSRRVAAGTTRLALFTIGSLLIASAVAVMLWNQIGPGPLDVFIGAVKSRTGLPLTFALWLTIGMMLAVAWALGRRPGAGSVIGPIVVGPVMQVTLEQLQAYEPPSSLALGVVVHVAAVLVVGIGAGALIVSGLGAGSGELLAAAASDRSGHPEPRVRFAFEATWIVLGVALGGPVGVGTVIVALLIGPAVAFGSRTVESLVTASRRHIDLVTA